MSTACRVERQASSAHRTGLALATRCLAGSTGKAFDASPMVHSCGQCGKVGSVAKVTFEVRRCILQGDADMVQHKMHRRVRLPWDALHVVCTSQLGPASPKVRTQPWHVSAFQMPGNEGLTQKGCRGLTGLLTE